MSKNEFSFYDFDKFLYEIFNDKDVLKAAKSVGDGINYFQAIQSNVFEALCLKELGGKTRNFLQQIKLSVRTYGFDHKIKKELNKLLSKKYSTAIDKDCVMFFCENFVPHILNDFIKISNALNKSYSLVLVTTDYRAYRYIRNNNTCTIKAHLITKFVKDNKEYSLLKKKYSDFFKNIFFSKKNVKKYYNEIEYIFFKNLRILYEFKQTFNVFLEKNKPKAIFIGSDGFSVSRILIYAAKLYNVPTYVFQHGLLGALNGYLPLVADKIFVWSEFDKLTFKKYGIDDSRIVITGTPRFLKERVNNKIINEKKKKIFLFITSPTGNMETESQIDAGVSIYKELTTDCEIEFRIRPHPYALAFSIAFFKKKYRNFIKSKEILLDTKNFDESLNETDIVLFAEMSTTLFEAICNNKLCILIQLKNSNKENNGIHLYKIRRHTIQQALEIMSNPIKMNEYRAYLAEYKKMFALDKIFSLIETEIDSI